VVRLVRALAGTEATAVTVGFAILARTAQQSQILLSLLRQKAEMAESEIHRLSEQAVPAELGQAVSAR
jgi:hypothetical protein